MACGSPEGFLEADRHLRRDPCPAVHDPGERLSGDSQGPGAFGHR